MVHSRNIPSGLWLLFDMSNGSGFSERGDDARHYAWWFDSRAAAMARKNEHAKRKGFARLHGPFKYVLATARRAPITDSFPKVSCWGLDGEKMSTYVSLGYPGGIVKSEEILPEIIVDRWRGRPMGVEFVEPDKVTRQDMAKLARKLGMPSLADLDVASVPITCNCRSDNKAIRSKMLFALDP